MEETRLHYRARMQRILKDLIEQTPVFTLFDPEVALQAILCFGVNDWDVPALMKGKVEKRGFDGLILAEHCCFSSTMEKSVLKLIWTWVMARQKYWINSL